MALFQAETLKPINDYDLDEETDWLNLTPESDDSQYKDELRDLHDEWTGDK